MWWGLRTDVTQKELGFDEGGRLTVRRKKKKKKKKKALWTIIWSKQYGITIYPYSIQKIQRMECFWGGADSDGFMETHEQRSVGGQVRALS